MNGLEEGDAIRVRVRCPWCGDTSAIVARKADRSLVMARRFRSHDWAAPRLPDGQPPIVFTWERVEMNEALMAQIQTGRAATRNATLSAYCDCVPGPSAEFHLDYRSIAPHLAEADRTGSRVNWRLTRDDQEVAAMHKRRATLTLIPDDERRQMLRRTQELDPSGARFVQLQNLTRMLADPELPKDERERLQALAREVGNRSDTGRRPVKRPKSRAQR